MTLDKDDFEDYLALNHWAAGHQNSLARQALKHLLLTHTHIAAPLPPSPPNSVGEAFVVRRGLRFYEGALISEYFDPQEYAITPLDREVEVSGLLSHVESFDVISRAFRAYLSAASSRGEILVHEANEPHVDSYLSDYVAACDREINFDQQDPYPLYAFFYLYRVAVVSWLRRQGASRSGSPVETFDAFAAFLLELDPTTSIDTLAPLYGLIENTPQLLDWARDWISSFGGVSPIKSVNLGAFHGNEAQFAALFMRRTKQDPNWAFAPLASEVEDAAGAQIDSISDVARRQSEPIQRIKLIVSDGKSYQPPNLTLEQICELRHEDRFVALQPAVGEIYRQLRVRSAERPDLAIIREAVGEIQLFREHHRTRRYAAVANRMITYASIPVGLVEALTYGGRSWRNCLSRGRRRYAVHLRHRTPKE